MDQEHELTLEELAAQKGEPLPDREAMSVLNMPGSGHLIPAEPPTGGPSIEPLPPDSM